MIKGYLEIASLGPKKKTRLIIGKSKARQVITCYQIVVRGYQNLFSKVRIVKFKKSKNFYRSLNLKIHKNLKSLFKSEICQKW